MLLQLPLERPWHKNTQLVNVEAALAPYLYETHSLTAKLKSSCDSFSVSVLSDELKDVPDTLKADLSSVAWCREVTLNCNGRATIYGQSWLNEQARNTGVHLIGDTPLGEILFSDLNWHRGELEYIRLRASEYSSLAGLMGASLSSPTELFARKSWFKNGNAKILVCEVFISESFYD